MLNQDADGHVELWDITRGVVVKNFGSVSLKDAERKLFQVPSLTVPFSCYGPSRRDVFVWIYSL